MTAITVNSSTLVIKRDLLFCRTVSQQFGIAMSTGHDTVEMVVDNILKLLPQVIKMPRQESEFRKLADEFYKYGYPNVVGALDGTGIKVTVPASDKNDYFTYKYSTNINLTALCDAKKRLLNIHVGQSERNHDSHIFRCSPLGKMILADNAIPPQFHIVADAAYGLHTDNMIPYPNKGHLPDELDRYINIHSSTRMVIERTFGDIKNRWLRLQTMRCELSFATKIIAACCVLHNICIDSGDITPTHIPPMSGCHVLSVRSATTKRQDILRHLSQTNE